MKRSLKSENTDLAVIPGGLTSVLQPLDVCLNKPFKDRVRQRWMAWMAWMADGIHELMATGRQKKPSEELMCQWIGKAWCDIPREMVAGSFLKCGITNTLGWFRGWLCFWQLIRWWIYFRRWGSFRRAFRIWLRVEGFLRILRYWSTIVKLSLTLKLL